MAEKKEFVETPQEIEERKCFETQQEGYYQAITEATMKGSDEQDLVFDQMDQLAAGYEEEAFRLRRKYVRLSAAADELRARMKDLKKSQRKRRLFGAAPANGVIDYDEEKKNSFAQGMNLYKVFLLLFFGSLFGVLIESAWCIMQNGVLESRAGLVWGPFNLLYGVGAVALTWALYPYRNRSSAISFVGGMIVGSILEYLCSWGQEVLIGSTSWDYSAFPFNLDGRICLLYSIFWGILGVVWIKSIYPRMAYLFLYIPNKPGKVLGWLMVIFLAVNSIVSCAAVYRWSERLDGKPASNEVEEVMDQWYPNETLETIYANMTFDQE